MFDGILGLFKKFHPYVLTFGNKLLNKLLEIKLSLRWPWAGGRETGSTSGLRTKTAQDDAASSATHPVANLIILAMVRRCLNQNLVMANFQRPDWQLLHQRTTDVRPHLHVHSTSCRIGTHLRVCRGGRFLRGFSEKGRAVASAVPEAEVSADRKEVMGQSSTPSFAYVRPSQFILFLPHALSSSPL